MLVYILVHLHLDIAAHDFFGHFIGAYFDVGCSIPITHPLLVMLHLI